MYQNNYIAMKIAQAEIDEKLARAEHNRMVEEAKEIQPKRNFRPGLGRISLKFGKRTSAMPRARGI
jgi:hypothetical protein